MRKGIAIGLLLLFFTACNFNRIYERHEGIPQLVWERDNVLEFEVEIPEAEKPYDLLISVRHAFSFPYVALPILIEYTDPSGDKASIEHSLVLKDENKNWIGGCMGEMCDVEVFVRQIKFLESGDYLFRIIQNGRENMVPLVMELGLIIEKVPES